jgi:SAM-dependent methyltransferase
MRGEWFEWEWDETLFAGTAPFYDQGRLPYAPGLADAFQRALGLDGRGRLLDIGCGPGTVTLPLSPLFQDVVGVDADAGMIVEGQRLAAVRGVHNARWVHGRAEQLPAGLGVFRVVTFAASFHWLDRPLVAGLVAELLERDGVVVHVDNRHRDGLITLGDDFPAPPVARIDELRRRYLGDDRRAGRGIRNSSPGDEATVFRNAGFTGPQIVVVPDGRTIVRSSDDLVAETFSISATAPHLFGDQLSEFETDLRCVLAEASPGGRFSVRLPDNGLNIWRISKP